MTEKLLQPQLPETVMRALHRKAVPLNESLVKNWRHRDGVLRNSAELADLKMVIPQHFQGDHYALGVVGSRTESRFVYSAEQLHDRLLYTYGSEAAVDRRRVAQLAEWLAQQAAQHSSLNDIKLETLPLALQELILIQPFVKLAAFPSGVRGDEIFEPMLPLPGALFPDIDIWAITKGDASEDLFDHNRSKIILGKESGTLFQVHHLMVREGQQATYPEPALKALAQFIPLRV